MNDAFLPGNGFDTYEEQDRVLMGLSGSVRSGVAVRILQHPRPPAPSRTMATPTVWTVPGS